MDGRCPVSGRFNPSQGVTRDFMVHLTGEKRVRVSFARIDEVLQMPNLIEIQQNSYQWFLHEGLREMFRDISPK